MKILLTNDDGIESPGLKALFEAVKDLGEVAISAPAQQASATKIFTDSITAGETVRTNLQTNRQSLADAVKMNNSATIDQLALTLGSLEGQLISINSKAEAAFYAILTPDQQTKYDALPHGGPGGGPGGPGGGGP